MSGTGESTGNLERMDEWMDEQVPGIQKNLKTATKDFFLRTCLFNYLQENLGKGKLEYTEAANKRRTGRRRKRSYNRKGQNISQVMEL